MDNKEYTLITVGRIIQYAGSGRGDCYIVLGIDRERGSITVEGGDGSIIRSVEKFKTEFESVSAYPIVVAEIPKAVTNERRMGGIINSPIQQRIDAIQSFLEAQSARRADRNKLQPGMAESGCRPVTISVDPKDYPFVSYRQIENSGTIRVEIRYGRDLRVAVDIPGGQATCISYTLNTDELPKRG